MDWQRCFFDGNLQNYIDNCRKFMMELEAISIAVPNEFLSYSLLGKLGGNPHLSQFVKTLIFNEDIIEKPLAILSQLQDFAIHNSHSGYTQNKKETISSALITEYDKPRKIVFYFSQGKHNIQCTTHKKEECWSETPHLRPLRQEKKQKNNPKSHLSIAQALAPIGGLIIPMRNQVIGECGATHHMFNSPKFFPNSFEEVKSKVATGDSQSNLLVHGTGNAELKCSGQILNLKKCLFLPKLKCNIISMLELFKDQLTIKQTNNSFFLSSKGEVLLEGEIYNRLMYITYDLPNALLTFVDGKLWHCHLGHPGRAVLRNLGLPDQESSCQPVTQNRALA
ncbi:hypothetical protein O181_005716 [Austropuccinia psidii MF-1]|uniref:Retrovirus-related Pol polyprotein from transposon TNT 1-94-like beta-barrel domain-containing protein n=1 Tax=Austropuccinia psidii MF-1 TaxID=1389203 RepID=A0A9Q3GG49_9BASI|nr:hypothetical protein [Austropuccinia psidii MF-1]